MLEDSYVNIDEANFKVVQEARERDKQKTEQLMRVLKEGVFEKGRLSVLLFIFCAWLCAIHFPIHLFYINFSSKLIKLTMIQTFCLMIF